MPVSTTQNRSDAAKVLLPEADIFHRRAERLRHLALRPGAAWLSRLAELAAAQQAAFNGLQCAALPAPPSGNVREPVLAAREAELAAAWPAVYSTLVDALKLGDLPPAERVARAVPTLRNRLNGAASTADGGLAEMVLGAALQVVWTAAAKAADLSCAESAFDGHDRCPCCGSAALGGIVLAGDGRAGLRYLECSLCATRWNAIRARCTLCADHGVVNYLSLEGAHPGVRAEACDACHGYVKIFFREQDGLVEPLADDLATLALDVLLGEQGYGRGAPNPFLPVGEAS